MELSWGIKLFDFSLGESGNVKDEKKGLGVVDDVAQNMSRLFMSSKQINLSKELRYICKGCGAEDKKSSPNETHALGRDA